MIKKITDSVKLNNGIEMPWLGFGVFQINDGGQVKEAVLQAIEAGYRSIDTATVYDNEGGVGQAVRESGQPRAELFLTTKVWNTDQRARRPLAAFEESLERLNLEYVDLYLVHWPVAGLIEETWQVMEEIYQSGRARSIGVSNFQIHHLEKIIELNQTVPAVNQIEFHPYLVQPELTAFCREKGIQVEAWSPLMQGHIVEVPVVQEISRKYSKTPAQIVLRWDLQHEVVTIPKSVHQHRIIENAGIFDFELTDSEMKRIDALDRGKRFGPDPDNFDF